MAETLAAEFERQTRALADGFAMHADRSGAAVTRSQLAASRVEHAAQRSAGLAEAEMAAWRDAFATLLDLKEQADLDDTAPHGAPGHDSAP